MQINNNRKRDVMIRFNKNIYLVAWLLTAGLLVSCERDDAAADEYDRDVVQNSAEIVSPGGTRAADGTDPSLGDGSGEGTTDGTYQGDVTGESLKDYFTKGVSKLFVSYRGSGSGATSFDFKETSSSRYTYIYNENTSATWTSDYNFEPDPNEPLLNWSSVPRYGNGYGFGAMYFPVDYTYRTTVAEDQSVLDSMKKSDILAAWHRAYSPEERLRFKLHHLMAWVHVTLYVPTKVENFKFTNSMGGQLSTGRQLFGITGYDVKSAADLEAQALNMNPNFKIEWGSRSSEESPDVSAGGVDPVTGEDIADSRKDIPMYFDTGKLSTVYVSLGEFGFKDGNGLASKEYDQCKKCEFDVMVPSQPFDSEENLFRFSFIGPVPATDENGKPKTDEEGNLIYEGKRGVTESWVFASSMLVNFSTLTLRQAYRTHLELYLPRTGGEIILVAARIKPWTEVEQDFGLVDTPEEGWYGEGDGYGGGNDVPGGK